MAKASREQIRKDRQEMIKLLMEDGDTTITEMSKKLGFSRQKTWRHLKQLKRTKKIMGSTPILDETFLDRDIYYMNFSTPRTDSMQDFYNTVTKSAKESDVMIRDMSITAFLQEIHLKILAKDPMHLIPFKNNILMKYPNITITTDKVQKKIIDSGVHV